MVSISEQIFKQKQFLSLSNINISPFNGHVLVLLLCELNRIFPIILETPGRSCCRVLGTAFLLSRKPHLLSNGSFKIILVARKRNKLNKTKQTKIEGLMGTHRNSVLGRDGLQSESLLLCFSVSFPLL